MLLLEKKEKKKYLIKYHRYYGGFQIFHLQNALIQFTTLYIGMYVLQSLIELTQCLIGAK